MTGPYGITQVDVPGALNVFEAARSNRIRQMLLQRQLQQEERALDTRRGMSSAVDRYLNGGQAANAPAEQALDATGMAAPAGDAVAPYGGALQPPAVPAPDAAGGVPALAPAAAPAAAPGGHGDLTRLASELIAIDAEQALPIIAAFRQMDEAQFTTAQRRNATLGRAAYTLLALPEDQWSAAFQRMAPDLVENGGVTRQQLAGFELTRENLTHIANQSRDVEKLAEEARPSYRNVEGEVLDERRLERGEDPVVYRSEYISTPEGLARRPGAGVQAAPENLPRPATPEDARRLAPGTRFLDPNGVVRTVPGGPTQPASGNFP